MSEPIEPTILLINRALAYNCLGRLTGWSGVQYGDSVYEEAYGAHVCRLPLSVWREHKADITRASMRPLSQWEVDIDLPESPAGAEDVSAKIHSAKSVDELDAIVCCLSPFVQSVYARMKELRPPAPAQRQVATGTATGSNAGATATRHTAESLSAITNYRVLLKAARETGVENPDRFDSTPQLREAILAKQGDVQPA